ncbi:MAG TPA: hypothetical protein VMZ25_03100 [Terriglobales bacterium]|nr:hypothetical protein [Terriglobales bacterium]
MNKSYFSSFLLFSFSVLLLVGCGEKSGAPTSTEKPTSSQTAAVKIDPATAGSVAGVVKFEGASPKAQAIDMSQDPACTMGAAPNSSEAFAVKGGKLGNVFVYVKEGLPAGKYEVPQPTVIDQKGCKYVPHVAGAMAGQKVQFLNSDPTMHNVHPDAQANSPWNVTQTPKGEPIEKSFPHAELMMKVSCNQHPWMRMYLNVVEHPFFAVSDAEGKFEIAGLPAGDYLLGFVHEKLGEETVEVKVEAQKAAKVEISFGVK